MTYALATGGALPLPWLLDLEDEHLLATIETVWKDLTDA